MADPNAYYSGGLSVTTYDLFTAGGLLEGDIEFYLDCARRFGGPVLELGTGTGRILIPLAAAGYEVFGLDASPAMLGVAAGKLRETPDASANAHIAEGDMRDFDLGRRFSLIIIPARSFQHVLTPEGQRATLRCVHQHLEPSGHLILDLFDPNFEMLFAEGPVKFPSREAPLPNSDHLVRRTLVARRTDPLRQTVEETLRFEKMGKNGVVAGEETSWTLRWSMRQEISYLLELSGFEVVDQFSDFRGSPPDYGREQIWVARSL
jgi:SAM-dependent methyltransferase